ncbi:MAG TPA: carboxypeptidase-like regulatory domain-containing protein [Bacteroidales bacterium]|nr:carboxypeptidase-like regulatory domain-containing protein [Bacteroidales bacterium]
MHRVKSIFLIAATFLVSLSLFADTEKGNVRKGAESSRVVVTENVKALQLVGIIVDAENNETLAGASIIVNGEKYYSDLEGKFTIPHIKPGKQELTVELISYEPVSIEVDGSKDKTITIKLLQK